MRNALVTVRAPTAEQSLLKRRQEAGYNTVFVPDTNPASELNQKSLNKYSSPFQFLERVGLEHTSPSLRWTGCSFDLQADRAAHRKRVAGGPGGPGAAPPQLQVAVVTRPTSPERSEAEEVLLLRAAAVRLVPVDRREALGVMDVLCCQSSVQDLRVCPRLGEPGRQSCVSRGAGKGLTGAWGASPARPAPGSEVRGHEWENARAQGPNDSGNGGAGSGRLTRERLGHTHHPWLHQEMPKEGKGPQW